MVQRFLSASQRWSKWSTNSSATPHITHRFANLRPLFFRLTLLGLSGIPLMVLFSEVGVLRRYSIHYDKSGRSKGTAEVVFARRSDAFAAVKRYNNVQLDGKPMKIEMVGLKLVTPAAITIPPTSSGILGNQGGAFRRQERNERNAGRGRDRGSGGRGPVRGRGRGRGHGEKMSTADLDADLEKYHKEAMQIN